MNRRLALISEAVKMLGAAIRGCEPKPRSFKVSYRDRKTGYWTSKIVEAVTSKDAAEQLGFRAGHNCFVTRYIKPR